jgi:hypothetical protein
VLSDAEARAHPSAARLAEVEREHLRGSAWWLRLLGLVPLGDALLLGPATTFYEWVEAYSHRR